MRFKKAIRISIVSWLIIFLVLISFGIFNNLIIPPRLSNHLTIFVDSSFTDLQYREIYWGIKEWEFASSQDIKFNVIKKKIYFWERYLSKVDQKITIYNAIENNWQKGLLVDLVDEIGNRTIACTLTKSLDIFFVKKFMLETTTTHEIGHVLLKGENIHSDNPFSVMFPEIGGNVQYVTIEDMKKIRESLNIKKD